MCADIVIFDLRGIQDKATYQEPHQYPEGIHFVIVNGKVAVQEGEVLRNNGGLVIYGHGKGDE